MKEKGGFKGCESLRFADGCGDGVPEERAGYLKRILVGSGPTMRDVKVDLGGTGTLAPLRSDV